MDKKALLEAAHEFFADAKIGEVDDVAAFLSTLNDGSITELSFDGVQNVSSNDFTGTMCSYHSDIVGKAVVLEWDIKLYGYQSVEGLVDYIIWLEGAAQAIEANIKKV